MNKLEDTLKYVYFLSRNELISNFQIEYGLKICSVSSFSLSQLIFSEKMKS
jgi:hypothetical protein